MTYLPSGLDYIRSLETATVHPELDTATVRQCLGDTETAILLHFYRAMLCIRGTSHGPVSVSVCLSVCGCLSQVGVLLKRINVGSHKQHHTIAQGL